MNLIDNIMLAHSIFFYTFSFIAIVSAIMLTVSKNTVHSVFFLILDFISVSCLFIMIGAEFLGMMMLIIYVGAVAVLFLFVVMMLNVAQQTNEWFVSTENSSHIPVGLLISLIIFFELIIVIGGWKFKPDLITSMSLPIDQNSTNTHSIGNVLYTDYIHIFQLSGMILLVAMIGAIILTFRQRSGLKRQSYFSQISREKSDGVKLVDVESNKGVNVDD
jgi:NADH-quinone oxidoreductase subunit J